MADIIRHPRSPMNSNPSTLEEAPANARCILAAPKIEFGAAVDLVTEMYERSALPAPPDLKAYIRGLADALTGYQEPIARECCDPRRGVTRRLKWRPEVNDILDFCDQQVKCYQSLAGEVPDRDRPVRVIEKSRPPRTAEAQASINRQVSEAMASLRSRGRQAEEREQAEEVLRRLVADAAPGRCKIAASEQLIRSIEDHNLLVRAMEQRSAK